MLQLGIALPLLASGPALAEESTLVQLTEEQRQASAAAADAAKLQQVFLETTFQFQPPEGFNYVDTQPPYDPNRRGPAPPPSPVLARYDAPDGAAVVSVLVRNAQNLKQSIVQISDVSAFGSLEEAARLLLPQASTVLAADVVTVVIPPRETTVGVVQLPPKNYYRYEFTTPAGLHVVMTAAAQKGKVYVCGGSTAVGERWDRYSDVLRRSTQTFRLRSDGKVL